MPCRLRVLTEARFLKHCRETGRDPEELLERIVAAYLKAQAGMDLQRARARAHRAVSDG